MNINAVSTGFQPAKAYNTVNFKGVQKAAAQLANAGAAQKTANKTGKIGQFFSKVSHTIRNACSKAFSAVKKTAVKAYNVAAKGVKTALNGVKSAGKKVTESVSNFFKGIKNKKHTKISKNKENTVIQINKNSNKTNTLTIKSRNGNVIINGKIYQYDGKLPDDIKINPDGGFSVTGANKIRDLSRKIQDFAETVEKNGKLIGTEA